MVKTEPVLMAAFRDASWFRYPGLATRYHVCAPGRQHLAACNPDAAPLYGPSEVPASEVPQRARCRRPGCKKLWPAEVLRGES